MRSTLMIIMRSGVRTAITKAALKRRIKSKTKNIKLMSRKSHQLIFYSVEYTAFTSDLEREVVPAPARCINRVIESFSSGSISR